MSGQEFNWSLHVSTLLDDEIDWNDALAIADIAIGTSFNKANKGDALRAINKIVEKTRSAAKLSENYKRGRIFQDQVLNKLGLPENVKKLSIAMDDGSVLNVIPDAYGKVIVSVVEVKDVVKLSSSRQFRAYAASNLPIELVVSPRNSYISEPLKQLILKSGGTIKVFDASKNTLVRIFP